MNKSQERITTILLLAIISILYFFVFIPANNTGARDPVMISIFEPDEFAQYSIPRVMLTEQDTFKRTVYNFIAYEHYYYGYPFYIASILAILPLHLIDGINNQNAQTTMLVLRQAVSVLPMLMAIWLIVFMRTRLKNVWKSLVLFAFLLCVPAIVENNLWWHPDSLVVFFIVATIFFLEEDQYHFGRFFWFAAISCGLAVGTKVLGLFFFATIPLYLILGIAERSLNVKKALLMAIGFVSVMVATIILTNPYVLIPSEFNQLVQIMTRQSRSMASGWVLNYSKGPQSWYPILTQRYGSLSFFLTTLILLCLSIRKPTERRLGLLVLSWVLPLSIYILFFVAIKPTHFFLPIILPLFSVLNIGFDSANPKFIIHPLKNSMAVWKRILGIVFWCIVIFQFSVNIKNDFAIYQEKLHREETNSAIQFFQQLSTRYLETNQKNDKVNVLRDVRVYFPASSHYKVSEFYNTLTYPQLESKYPDILILWKQRISDYTQSSAAKNSVDPESFKEIEQFFLDAKKHQIKDYILIYENDFGMAYGSIGFIKAQENK